MRLELSGPEALVTDSDSGLGLLTRTLDLGPALNPSWTRDRAEALAPANQTDTILCKILDPSASDMSLEGVWHAHPQLFLCRLRPRNGRPHKNTTWTRGPDDMEACLVFFSTFDELKFPGQATGPMDCATTKLYKQSPTPILNFAPCNLMLGSVPLFLSPSFLQGDATPSSPPYLTSRCTSRPERFSTESPTQPLWTRMAIGGAT